MKPWKTTPADLKSWLDQMKGDANFIFRASKMASATTDFLLAFVREPEKRLWSGEVGEAPAAEKAAGALFFAHTDKSPCTSSLHREAANHWRTLKWR